MAARRAAMDIATGAAPEISNRDTDPDNTQPADLAKLKRYFAEARDLTEVARSNSLIAIDYYDNDQYTPAELAALRERRQPPIVVNRIKPAINGIVGVTERSRSDPRAWPREPGKTDQADTVTDILRYICDFNRFKSVKRDCFTDMLVPGTCAALMGVDDDRHVTITQVRWEEFFGDPRSRRRDYKDARFLGIAKWMYADDAMALYPGKRTAIEATIENGVGGGMVPDMSFQDRPLQGSSTGGAWVDRKQRRLMVVEMYYREGSWKRAVFTGSDILEEGASPYLDHKGKPDCPIEAMSAYVRPDNARYGVAWDMLSVQDEINKRRSKALHLLNVSRIQAKDPAVMGTDVNVARAEAARPDGVLPFGWVMAPSVAEFQGNVELMQEAKAEMERMAPNPAVLGRGTEDSSGRALLARQQAGLVELAVIFGALEDWELRVYRQCWARAKQFWTAPVFIRVTDDEDAPKFVGLNQPVLGQPAIGVHPETGLPAVMPQVLGYRNAVAEMDVDIEVDAQPDTGTVAQEQFSELMAMVGSNPQWQTQIPLTAMIQLSQIPHKRSVLDVIKQAQEAAQEANAQAQQLQQAHAVAKIHETQASALQKTAQGQASVLNALTEAQAMHAEHAGAGFEAGVGSVRDANATQQRIQAHAIESADTDNGGEPIAPQPQ
ncbi:MAG: hypothetical protein ACREEB_04200 [Caulobacteraceae bacterium]